MNSGVAYPMLENEVMQRAVTGLTYTGKQALGVYGAFALTSLAHELGHAAAAGLLYGPDRVLGFSYGGYCDDQEIGKKFLHIKSSNPRQMAAYLDLPEANSTPNKIKNFTISAVGPLAGTLTAAYFFSKIFPNNDMKILENLPIALTLAYCAPSNYFNLLDLNPKKYGGFETDGYRMSKILSADRENFNDTIRIIGAVGCMGYLYTRFKE